MYLDMSVIGFWKGYVFCLVYIKLFYSNFIKYLMVLDELYLVFIEVKIKCKNDFGYFVSWF